MKDDELQALERQAVALGNAVQQLCIEVRALRAQLGQQEQQPLQVEDLRHLLAHTRAGGGTADVAERTATALYLRYCVKETWTWKQIAAHVGRATISDPAKTALRALVRGAAWQQVQAARLDLRAPRLWGELSAQRRRFEALKRRWEAERGALQSAAGAS